MDLHPVAALERGWKAERTEEMLDCSNQSSRSAIQIIPVAIHLLHSRGSNLASSRTSTRVRTEPPPKRYRWRVIPRCIPAHGMNWRSYDAATARANVDASAADEAYFKGDQCAGPYSVNRTHNPGFWRS